MCDSSGGAQARPYVPEFLYTYKTQYKVEQEHKVKQSKATKILEPNWPSKREVDKEMNKRE